MEGLGALLQNLSGGLLIGGVYALIGVGLTLIFGVMRVINFAHGEFLAVGMYAALLLHQGLGLDPYLGLLIVLPLGFALGFALERLVLSRLVDAPEDSTLLATLGLALIVSNTLLLFFGAEPKAIFVPYATTTIQAGPVTLSVPLMLAGGVALFIIVGLSALLNYTTPGRAIRATAQNRLGAELIGIDTLSVHGIVFGLGTMFAMAAGMILMPLLFAIPTIGGTFTLKAFVVTVLGGMGNIAGAIGGGLVLGVVEVLGASYLSSGYRDAYGLLAFLLVLLVRPQGLFGRRNRRV